MKLRILIISFLILISKMISGQKSDRMVNDFLEQKAIKGASVGIVVSDVRTGKNIVAHNPEMLLAPASTAKLITSGVALHILEPGFRFETVLGYFGVIDKNTGTLNGSLVIKGGGDPTLGSAWFDKDYPIDSLFDDWVKALKTSGIFQVSGDIVLDISGFQKWALPGTWMWEDLGNYYGTGPSALNIYDNTVKLYFNSPKQAGMPTQIVSVRPEIPEVDWINEVLSSEINRDLAYVFASPWDTKRVIRGTIPANRNSFEVKASMPGPENIFGEVLKNKLILAGISVQGNVLVVGNGFEFNTIKKFYSPPLAKICSVLNYESVNLIAESLVMQLAYQQQGFGHHSHGMKIITGFLKDNITPDPVFLDDGSGLSRFSAVSARQMVDFLLYMHSSKYGEVLKSTLPIAGAGTLRSFKTSDFPGITLRCKSGSMTRVRAYAGYLVGKSGREMAFAVMVNNFSGTQQEVFGAIEGFLVKARNEL